MSDRHSPSFWACFFSLCGFTPFQTDNLPAVFEPELPNLKKMNASLEKKVPVVIRAILVFIVAYITVFAVFYFSTQYITERFVPVFAYIIERAYPENELVSLEATSRGGKTSIHYTMKIHKRLEGIEIPLVDYLNSSIYASFQFVTLIIYYSLLLSWPSLSPVKKVKAFLLSFPFLILFVSIDIPVTVISSIELECERKLHGIPMVATFSRSFLMFLSHFFNNGGRQFFALMLFALTVLPFRFRSSSPKPLAVRRKDPCPCGSGKKYKNCCMK